MKNLQEALKISRRAVAFTGAGVSTLCGIPDFRGPGGLYSKPDAQRMFDIHWFHQDPSLYYQSAREWIYNMGDIAPGPVHTALARLEAAGIVRGVVTQNIDMLHQRAGSKIVAEVHGSPQLHHCIKCGSAKTFSSILDMLKADETAVPMCPCGAPYKPDITFFGENLPTEAFDLAEKLMNQADLILVLGSSLTVFPAASLPERATRHGTPLYIVNAQPTPLDSVARQCYTDLAAFAKAAIDIL
jgi:NAD-dependent deacetylase